MLAGIKAQENGSLRMGFVGQFPVPEIVRFANATVLGMLRTCPQCVADVRWSMSWSDSEKEIANIQELQRQGAGVIIINSARRESVQNVSQSGLSIIVNNSIAACEGLEEYCLGVTYWNWGPAYLELIGDIQ